MNEEMSEGKWRPSCPEPYHLWRGRCRCECGERFKSRALYEAHWRRWHDPTYQCGGDGCPGCSDCHGPSDTPPENLAARVPLPLNPPKER